MRIKEHLREKIGVGQLKCLCARFIRRREIVFQNYGLPVSLIRFIEKH